MHVAFLKMNVACRLAHFS